MKIWNKLAAVKARLGVKMPQDRGIPPEYRNPEVSGHTADPRFRDPQAVPGIPAPGASIPAAAGEMGGPRMRPGARPVERPAEDLLFDSEFMSPRGGPSPVKAYSVGDPMPVSTPPVDIPLPAPEPRAVQPREGQGYPMGYAGAGGSPSIEGLTAEDIAHQLQYQGLGELAPLSPGKRMVFDPRPRTPPPNSVRAPAAPPREPMSLGDQLRAARGDSQNFYSNLFSNIVEPWERMRRPGDVKSWISRYESLGMSPEQAQMQAARERVVQHREFKVPAGESPDIRRMVAQDVPAGTRDPIAKITELRDAARKSVIDNPQKINLMTSPVRLNMGAGYQNFMLNHPRVGRNAKYTLAAALAGLGYEGLSRAHSAFGGGSSGVPQPPVVDTEPKK